VDFGWPPRLFAAEVGFLGTWWVGLIGGWVLARVGLAELTETGMRYPAVKAFGIALGTAVLVGVIGGSCGVAVARFQDPREWEEWRQLLHLEDLPAFVVVCYLHGASYLGGLIGLITAVVYVRRCVKQTRAAAALNPLKGESNRPLP
jgi:hypothetical protein